jgi:hypothetical protein
VYKGAIVLTQRTLRDGAGRKVVDWLTKEGRRLDFVVVQATKDGYKAIAAFEVTSRAAARAAGKAEQLAREARIRELGGVFIRFPGTQLLIDVSDIPTIVRGLR